MMDTVMIIAALAGAYLLGSIPSSVWIGKKFFNTDVRDYGSGNAGATNTLRVLGGKAALPVFLLDIAKAFAAVQLVRLFPQFSEGTAAFVNFQLVLGAIAVLGHIFPIYVNFKGGKGVASMFGVVLGIHPLAAAIGLGIFIVILSISHYVSLGSMVAGISFPIMVIFIFKTTIPSLIIFSIILSALLLITHQKNIERLLKRQESKIYIFKRKRNNQD